MAPACVDICRPSATSASEPNRLPPTISTTIMTPHNAITPQVLRSFFSWPAPRKTWLWPSRMATSLRVFTAALLEVALNNIHQLFAGFSIRGRARKVGLDVILQNLAQQAVDRAATTRYLLQHIGATDFRFECALDGFNLTADPTHTVQQLGF